ncbi:MAG TPA: DUF2797 domain-containing protein [Methanomassiliicoccaceae archaeon]|jgi:hypothetical protein|nr:DUF2797 domain-containing protein [Euryarchaeota archaeon]HOB37710.1 DUF2797 domain-containing protein [Methanomassiliicoccaceae archaeon]HOK27493.1 DUF2797 domain-containing protein [Methanomassiliicoccaceae archaeon]HOL06982.1 DUF2797 domain-containing protein [Methanomassiliicoccaceae archaeon]HOQ25832.1 DUF2797 domain-containing protein [Methanomassiliicoccaceae archaeon]
MLDFSWEDFTPRLEAYDVDIGEVVLLPLDRLNMDVSEDRRCIGSFDGDYRPCPTRRPVGRFHQCRECMGSWADVQRCVFEPQCIGDGCEHNDFCGRRHVVYLAAFGTLVKVGMTSAARLRRRGIEQGADAIVPVLMCRDRQEARRLEKETSARFRLPQEIRISRIAAQWTHPPSRDIIENAIATHLRRVAAWREIMDEDIMHLDGYPMRSYPRTPPALARTSGHHAGDVLGIKGRFMIYRRPGRDSRLLDLSDLPSRTVVMNHVDDAPPGMERAARRYEQRQLDVLDEKAATAIRPT